MSGMKCRGLRGFAAGGIVNVPGASTSGVADDIHVDDAPVGAFVLPADSVQALRRSNPELLAQILAAIQQAGGDGGGQTAQIAISNGELFIPPAAVALLGGAEVLAAIKDATHQQAAVPAAKPLDAPPPPGGVNAPLDAVVQPPRGLPLGMAGAVLPDAAMPGSGQAQQQRTFFMDGGEVDEQEQRRAEDEARAEEAAAAARAQAAQLEAEAQERMQQERAQQMERDAIQQEWQAGEDARMQQRRRGLEQMFSQPAGLPGFGGQALL